MENNREEITLSSEIQKEKDMIINALCITEKVLSVLRGNTPQEDCECTREECILDSLKINSRNLIELNKNLEEIARKVIG